MAEPQQERQQEPRQEPEGAGAEPAPPPRIVRNKGRVLQQAAPSKRHLFDARRKERFLDFFAGTCNLSWAAREAGVHYRTVLRHRAEDAAFREAYDRTEAQAVPRLRAWAIEAKEEAGRRLSGAAGGPAEEEPGGDPAPVRLSLEQTLQYLRDQEQSQARREQAARMGPGRGSGRPVSVASNEEVAAALVRALKAHGIRVRSGIGTVTSDCPGEGEA